MYFEWAHRCGGLRGGRRSTVEGNGVLWSPRCRYEHSSWKLLELLKQQCDMPWVVFGDFNEIVKSDEKLGWLERDARQVEMFSECLTECGLSDLGFVG